MNTPTRLRALLTATALTAATVATAALTAPAAQARAMTLPAQTKNQAIADGTHVTINRTAERATIVGSMGGTPLHRSVTVSSRYSINLNKPATILLQAGYIVGCQVSVGALTSSDSGNGTTTTATGANSGSGTVGGTLSVGPGQAVTYYVTDYERADPFGANQHKFYVMYKNTTHAKLNYVNTTIGVNGCAGYAQARSFANVWIIGATADQIVTLYGKPFSIG